jgi:hypothetical protein
MGGRLFLRTLGMRRGQRHEPHAAGESPAGQQVRSGTERQPRLAGASWTEQRHPPHCLVQHQPAHVRRQALSADECRRRHRQVGWPVIRCPQRRKRRRQRWPADLKDALGIAEILEPVLTEVVQRDARWEQRRNQVSHDGGEHRLAAVGRRHQPGAAVERQAKVVAALQLHAAVVDADAHPDLSDGSPRLVAQRQLTVQCGQHGVGRRAERGVDGVADRLGDRPTVGHNGALQEVVMAPDGVSIHVRKAAKELSASFDVGEQEGNGPGR